MIRDLVAIFGVIAGFSYYVLTVRNAQRSQRMAEESRQIQVISSYFLSEGDYRTIIELMNMEWKDYDEFERKYGSDNNPGNYAKRQYIWNQFNNIGYMLKNDLLERKGTFELMHALPIVMWAKFGDVIKEIRRRYNQPLTSIHFEYLAEECARYMHEKGIDTTVPDTFFSYVPEE
jgi:hypothetical protein